MMVQGAPENEPSFVITMREHMYLCRQMAEAFGNRQFARPDPFDLVVNVVANHDRGWDEYDSDPQLDPATHLPANMLRVPPPQAFRTNIGSPDWNEAHHPFCGLISSMHSWGLYNKRFGYTRFVVRQRTTTSITVDPAFQAERDIMLKAEVARQERLRARLAEDPTTARLAAPEIIFQAYKQLTFFDTLALYFHLYHATERTPEEYICVPTAPGEDTSLTVTPVNETTYALNPFPFAGERLELRCPGRYMRPFAPGTEPTNLGAVLRATPMDEQRYILVPGA